MDEINRLKGEIEKLQHRLREESQRRLESERRCSLLEKLAYRDPQTGLRTEQYLHTRLREEIDRATRFPAATSLITLCLPGQAHTRLASLGQRLVDELRATDQVFRLDENGLAILLVETPAEGATQVLHRIADDLRQFCNTYGSSVTSFPVDANLADDFLRIVSERHAAALKHADGRNGKRQSAPNSPLH